MISPFVCELTNKVTRDDLENHFRSKAAVEAVAQAIVAISFVRICVALLEICPGEVFGSPTEVSFQSRYSTDHVYHFLPIGLPLELRLYLVSFPRCYHLFIHCERT